MLNSLLRPTLKLRNSLQQLKELSTNKTILLLRKRKQSQQKRTRLHFRKRNLLTATKERTLAGIEEGFDLLRDGRDDLLGCFVTLGLGGCFEAAEEVREDFAEECIDEEGEARAVEGVFGGVGGWEEVGWMRVRDELGYNAGFSDYFVVVGEAGDEAALVWVSFCLYGGFE
jgi:hypothetical protein